MRTHAAALGLRTLGHAMVVRQHPRTQMSAEITSNRWSSLTLSQNEVSDVAGHSTEALMEYSHGQET